MTEEEVKVIAGKKAGQLNMPWGLDVTAKRSCRIWPFNKLWIVKCRVPAEFSQTTIWVNDRTGEATPRRVLVAKRFGIGGPG